MIESSEMFREFETCPQKEPLASNQVITRPWEKIGIDLFELNGKELPVTVDYNSNF